MERQRISDHGDDRRQHPRAPVKHPVLYTFNLRGRTLDDLGYLADMSRGGVAVFTNRPVSTNRLIHLHLAASEHGPRLPVPCLVLDCEEVPASPAYRYKVRALLKESRKQNLLELRGFLTSVLGQPII